MSPLRFTWSLLLMHTEQPHHQVARHNTSPFSRAGRRLMGLGVLGGLLLVQPARAGKNDQPPPFEQVRFSFARYGAFALSPPCSATAPGQGASSQRSDDDLPSRMHGR